MPPTWLIPVELLFGFHRSTAAFFWCHICKSFPSSRNRGLSFANEIESISAFEILSRSDQIPVANVFMVNRVAINYQFSGTSSSSSIQSSVARVTHWPNTYRSPFSDDQTTSCKQTVFDFISQTIVRTEHNIFAGKLTISKIGGSSTSGKWNIR
jgi:hypothetical protein